MIRPPNQIGLIWTQISGSEVFPEIEGSFINVISCIQIF